MIKHALTWCYRDRPRERASARGRGQRGPSEQKTPSPRGHIVPRAHAASQRTHEWNETISQFGGLSNDKPTPSTSDLNT